MKPLNAAELFERQFLENKTNAPQIGIQTYNKLGIWIG